MVSPGCANCYAAAMDQRFHKGRHWGAGAPRPRTSDPHWALPLRWDRQAAKTGERRRVFPSAIDWLEPNVPIEHLGEFLELIISTPHLTWLLLTKRPEQWSPRIEETARYLGYKSKKERGFNFYDNCCYEWVAGKPPLNVWIGVSVEDQRRADERIPELLKIPARVRFLSCEPLLGPVDLTEVATGPEGATVHWVIVGGESGLEARPMHLQWARQLRDQSGEAGVPFFMKQMGGKRKPFAPIPDDLMIREFPEVGA